MKGRAGFIWPRWLSHAKPIHIVLAVAVILAVAVLWFRPRSEGAKPKKGEKKAGTKRVKKQSALQTYARSMGMSPKKKKKCAKGKELRGNKCYCAGGTKWDGDSCVKRGGKEQKDGGKRKPKKDNDNDDGGGKGRGGKKKFSRVIKKVTEYGPNCEGCNWATTDDRIGNKPNKNKEHLKEVARSGRKTVAVLDEFAIEHGLKGGDKVRMSRDGGKTFETYTINNTCPSCSMDNPFDVLTDKDDSKGSKETQNRNNVLVEF